MNPLLSLDKNLEKIPEILPPMHQITGHFEKGCFDPDIAIGYLLIEIERIVDRTGQYLLFAG